jgi:hypothetical protein
MMLTMTAAVKAMDSQRWVCRIHLFQFNVTSSGEMSYQSPEKASAMWKSGASAPL